MKVFHIISHIDLGGAERVAVSIAKGQHAGCTHHIVEVQRGRGAYTREMLAELKREGITVHRSWLPVVWHFHYLEERIISCLFPLRMLWLWLRWRPDVIHTHTEMPDMAVWLSLKLLPFVRVKVVRTIHNTRLWTGMQWVGPRVERFMQQRNANIAISEGVARAYVEQYGGSLPTIIHNGVAPVEQKQYSGIVAGKTNVLFAGRFEEQKGIATLCEIVKSLQDDDRYFFHIFGAGTQQGLVDGISHLPNVAVHPPLPNVASVMASFDYLIMPSLHEGLSILAIEASMNGLPLMANRCAGLIDTLSPDWSLVVTDNDKGQWLRLFKEVLPSVNRQTCIDKARKYAQEHFSIERMQEEYDKILLF